MRSRPTPNIFLPRIRAPIKGQVPILIVSQGLESTPPEGTPSKDGRLSRACILCHNAKKKCHKPSTGPCQRCNENGSVCVPFVPSGQRTRKRGPYRKTLLRAQKKAEEGFKLSITDLLKLYQETGQMPDWERWGVLAERLEGFEPENSARKSGKGIGVSSTPPQSQYLQARDSILLTEITPQIPCPRSTLIEFSVNKNQGQIPAPVREANSNALESSPPLYRGHYKQVTMEDAKRFVAQLPNRGGAIGRLLSEVSDVPNAEFGSPSANWHLGQGEEVFGSNCVNSEVDTRCHSTVPCISGILYQNFNDPNSSSLEMPWSPILNLESNENLNSADATTAEFFRLQTTNASPIMPFQNMQLPNVDLDPFLLEASDMQSFMPSLAFGGTLPVAQNPNCNALFPLGQTTSLDSTSNFAEFSNLCPSGMFSENSKDVDLQSQAAATYWESLISEIPQMVEQMA